MQILIHSELLDDLKLCEKKWYPSIYEEMPRVCRYLSKNGVMPGEGPVHYIKLTTIRRKTFHAGINLPQEKVGKRKGARIIYVKENVNLIKAIYVGGHKDKRYDDTFLQVDLIQNRYQTENYLLYTEDFNFRV